MVKINLGMNFTIFILFFGVAVIEAIQTKNWLKTGFWIALSLIFLFADNLKKK